MESRIQKIRETLKDKNLDCMLLYKPENRRYVSGFTGTTGYVVVTHDEAKFMTDFRYIEQAKTQCQGFEIIEISKEKPLTYVLNQFQISKLGIEEDHVTYGQYKDYSMKLDQIELIALDGALTKLRVIKDEDEINNITQAARIADKAFIHILKYVKPGIMEIEVALEIESFMKQKGASKLSFDMIVASGERSALPHGVASNKTLSLGDTITLDFGCVYNGYCSDMTRTFILGQATEKQKEIYAIVLEAQNKALQSVRPGITGAELDEIARDVISKKGYGAYFGHGLGHGVGLEIHELPHINQLGKEPLAPGMVITIEPGIYVPGFSGVRIEDLVVVTHDGYEVLSKSTKEFIELNR
ncbi:peptidase M24 [Alkaliphilus metalliredigens QYMF]|uniref:Peptidase M24 n=1 Tax=Alkaliphilus metalliredigens (strain QYMF) TaxID=293826 RepID=A6TR24_ALKMQ|nr:Xaa-Pro peptidase family protein [Alkaliphilus metalliredigens]ABR48642.1 peptidase M24 [Alkaliphilus metalliredigens QYMF]